MSALPYAPKPKPNVESKTFTILILFFSVSVAEFQQTRQVMLIKSAHTQPRVLYKLSNHESQWLNAQRDNCAIVLQAQYYWL